MTTLTKPVTRKTGQPFFHHGPDRDRRFVLTLGPNDMITMRPLRHPKGGPAEICVNLVDVYTWALRCRVNCERLEKARATKAKQDAARKTRRLERELRRATA